MSYIGDELRVLRREVDRLNKKLAKQRMPGKVTERKGRMVKLDLGEDPATGKKLISPWVRVQSMSAGKFKIFVLPSEGEQLYLESPSGVIGADSMATFGSFDDENTQPEQEEDEMVIEAGKTRFSVKDGAFTITVDGNSLAITPEGLKLKAGETSIDVAKAGFSAAATRYDFK